VPDVALSAASHDGYLVIQGHTATTTGLVAVGGTSAASPSFAGIMALVVQHAGSAQGNANPVLYTRALASTDPQPVAWSYPAPAVKPLTPGTLLSPLVVSW
jgi:subtilase family serine protease